uniref:Uncharacterized protein n=1 Tax=Solanum tuberosum TaxID=4113 RepID=M1DS60_SOLTU
MRRAASLRNATWLILPVVICLSQRLSHACVRRDYPLSLSISISGGKETYKDSLSNGELIGNNPTLESGGSIVRIVLWRSILSGGSGPCPLEGDAREGDSPVVPGPCHTTRRCLRVGLFGNATLVKETPITYKYHEGKIKRILKIESKSALGGKQMKADDAPWSDVER